MKKIFNYIILSAAVLAGVSLTSCSDDDLCTDQYNKDGVNILGFGPMPITRGETIRLTGTELNKVKEVLLPGGNQKLTPSTSYTSAQFAITNSEEMTVTIPDECVPGKLRLVTQRGDTVVSASNVSFVEEIEVTDINPKHVVPGDIVTISGEYVWNIAEIILAVGVKVPAEEFLVNTRKEIQFRVPNEAQSGAVTYNDGSESAEDVVIIDNLEVETAVITSISNAEPEYGDEIVISGKNFNLVTKVDFPSVQNVAYTLNAACTEMTVTVPMNCVSGSVVLSTASGLTASVEIAVPLATFESIEPAEDLNPGDVVTIKGTLLERIVRLDLPGGFSLTPGENTQYADNEFLYNKRTKRIQFRVPEGMGDGTVTMVQHENYSVQTSKIKIHREAGGENVIWQGSFTIGMWDAGMQDLAWGGYDWTTVSAGQVLSVYITPNLDAEGWSQIRLGNGSWSALPSTQGWGNDGNLDLTADDNCVRLTLTQEDVDALVNEGGLVICGAYFTITKITLPGGDGTVLWEGELIADNWSDQPYALSDAGEELAAANAQVGQGVSFYLTPIEPEWKLEILEGHWGPSYGAWCAPGLDTEDGKFEEYDLDANGGKVTIYLTQEMLDAAYVQQWWGGVFVLNGDNVKCTKITLE